MTHRLSTDYAKNYCNRTLILKVIVQNVVTCFFMGHSVLANTHRPLPLLFVCYHRFLTYLYTAVSVRHVTFTTVFLRLYA